MSPEETRIKILNALQYYIDSGSFIKNGYSSMHNGIWYSRNSNVISVCVAISKPGFESEAYSLTIDQKAYASNMNTEWCGYDFVKDKDTYFAGSMMHDYGVFTYEDFDIFRKFYKVVTHHEFR